LKLKDLAERLQCRLDPAGGADRSTIEIRGVAGIQQAQPGDLAFIANAKYQTHLATTHASAVIVGEHAAAAGTQAALLRCRDPYLAFARAVGLLVERAAPPPGVDPSSSIGEGVSLGEGVSIGPFAVVGAGAVVGARTAIYPLAVIGPGAVIGDDCVIHCHASVRERVRVGHRVILQNGSVIGSDGFGFVKQADGTHFKIPQYADVVIEDDVEIGANTTIDRPAVGETRIGAGTKIDNLVQIAHGVAVGRRSLIAGQAGIAGSSVLEDDVVLAGQVGVTGHIRIGQGVVVAAQAGVSNDIPAGEFISGFRGMPNRDWLKSSAVFKQLPTLKKRVADLEQRIAELEEKLAQCQTSPE
jgi:UDP-3-O-[3-hydroxymyristoyl] glucosamine N-acyltransferase